MLSDKPTPITILSKLLLLESRDPIVLQRAYRGGVRYLYNYRHLLIYRTDHLHLHFTFYPLKNGSLRNGVEKVPPPLGKRVRKQIRPRTIPQAYLLSPRGVISSFAGISSPPLKKVANNPHAKQRTLPLRPPMPSNNDVAKDNSVAVFLPNMA